MKATLSFAPRENPGHESEKYYRLNYIPEDDRSTSIMNFGYEEIRDIQLKDWRASHFKFDTHGMMLTRLDTQLTYDEFSDKMQVEKVYLTEVWTLLSGMFKTEDVYIFEYLVRKIDSSSAPRLIDEAPEGISQTSLPATGAHIDYTSEDIRDRICQIFKSDADSFLKREVRVVNVWKPLMGPVADWAMAYCDPNTVDFEKDTIEVDDVSASYVNEQFNIHYNPNQSWYYVPDQLPFEAMVFKQFDSRSPKSAVPHCATQPENESIASRRESIEVRALVFDGLS